MTRVLRSAMFWLLLDQVLLGCAAWVAADDSPALNAAIGKGNVVVTLEPRAYSIGAPLDGTAPNVTLRGIAGATRLVKAVAPSPHGILRIDHPYTGWSFEGVEFDGSARALVSGKVPCYFTAYLSGSRGVRFRRCRFRDTYGPVSIRDSEDIAFVDCAFFGTRPGGQKPSLDPEARPDGFYTSGIAINEQVRGLSVLRSRFHFLRDGIAGNAVRGQSGSDVRVEGCTFRSDWWDGPFARLRFTATKAEATRGGLVITANAPGFKAAFDDNPVISFRRELGRGNDLTQAYAGNVMASGAPFALAADGDVIETEDGRRATITAIASPASANVEGWEWIDTYEPCPPPGLSVGWRLSRYYACGTLAPAADTIVGLYFEPVNPRTGERAITDAKLDLTKLDARVLAKTNYSGLHLNGWVRGVTVTDTTFRGGWADQCSLFDLPHGATIATCRFLFGQDEGVTLTRCPGSIVTASTFLNSGVSAVFLGESDRSSVTANTITNWGLVNPHVGAIDGGAKGLAITGNVATVGPPARDWSRYLVRLAGIDSTGTVIAGNTDGGAKLATVSLDLGAAPKRDAVCVRDVRLVVGDGAKHVETVAAGPTGPQGPAGPMGPTGPQGPPGVVTPRQRTQGQATIPRSSTSVKVEHGLAAQPAPEDVGVVLWGATRVWLGGVDGKTLTFRTDKPAPASGVTFTWSASVAR